MVVWMKGSEMLISVRLMLILVCCALTLADKKNCDKGVITPEDPYFLEGQDLVLTCWRKHNVTPRHLYFKYADGYDRVDLDEKYMERNQSAVTLRIPNISKEFVANSSVSTSFYCYDRRGEKDVCISNVYVFFDYFPRKAENLNCVIDNWDSMICTWDLAIAYKNPDNYKVTCKFVQKMSRDDNDTVSQLLYVLRDDASRWASCPDGNKTSCRWISSNYHDAKMYIMSVAVKNTRLNITTRTEEKVFRRKDIVKPAPVKATDIAVEYFPQDPESVLIQWNHSSVLRDLLFNLTIILDCDLPKVYEVAYTPEYEEIIPAQQMLTGLNPNTRYNFSIKTKALDGSGPWSESTEKHFTTLSAVPRSAPHTRSGWFETLPGRCTTARNCENILVHWQPLSQCDIISNSTRYQLSSPLAKVTLESTKFSTEIEVLTNRSSVLQLNAISDEGVSTNFSMQMVYPEDMWPKVQRDLVIEYNKRTGVCNASIVVLENDSNFDNISHTIVWCTGEAKCEAPVDFYTMAENQTSTVLTVSHCEHKYRVGITTSGRRVATGEIIASKLSWVQCMFEEGKVPKVPLPAVELFNISGYAFKVSWSPYTCNTEDNSYVEYYRVSHCLVKSTDNCSCIGEVYKIDVGKQEHSAKVTLNTTIKTGSNICVWVKAKTRGGFGPRNTDDLYYTVGEPGHGMSFKGNGESGMNYLAVGGAVAGGLVLIFVAIGGIICILKKCRRCFRPVPIEIPCTVGKVPLEEIGHQTVDVLNPENENGRLIPESDSGTHTMSSHSSEGDAQSIRLSRNSNDYGMQHIEPDSRGPLSGLLAESRSRSGGGYNRVPTDADDYLFDVSNSSVGISVPTAYNQEEENIYDEIGSIPSQIDTGYMYLHPLERPPSASSDQVQLSLDSAVVTDNADVLDLQDNIASNGEDEIVRTEPVLDEKCLPDRKDNSVSGSEKDRSSLTEAVIGEKFPETVLTKSQELDCDLSLEELMEDVRERSEFKILPTRCEQRDFGENQNLNVSNEMTDRTERSEDLPTNCEQFSNSDFHWEQSVPSGNEILNIAKIENSAVGYTSASNIVLSESGSSEVCYGSGVDYSDSTTSHFSNIPHKLSHEHNPELDNLETHLDSQLINPPVHERTDTSNNEQTNLINIDTVQNDNDQIEGTQISQAVSQKHIENNKLKGGNSSGYSKATIYDQK